MRGVVRFIAVAVLVALTVSRLAAADPTQTPDDKDPGIAYALSIGGALAPIAIAAISADVSLSGNTTGGVTGLVVAGAGMIFLPSAGHWYAGRTWTWGLAMRLVGATVLTASIVNGIECEDCGEHTAGKILDVTSLALVVGGVVYDVATVGGVVRRWNDKHRVRSTPTVMPVGNGGWGFGVVGRF